MNNLKLDAKIENGKILIDEKTVKLMWPDGEYRITIAKKYSQRTDNQNRALHLWFTQLAEALNAAGFDMKKTMSGDVDIPWTAYNVKEFLWRPVQKTYLQKQSTTELDKSQDITKIYETINRHIALRTGIHVPFPSIETLIDQEQ